MGVKKKKIAQSRDLAPTISEIRRAVCKGYDIQENDLEQTKRGKMNEPRNMAVYLARKISGLRLDEIGQKCGRGKYPE